MKSIFLNELVLKTIESILIKKSFNNLEDIKVKKSNIMRKWLSVYIRQK